MVKERPPNKRVHDAEGYRLRAACVCVRSAEESEILLVTSTKNPNKWIVPGGGVEPGEKTAEAALREALEEAGVTGRLGRSLGIFEHPSKIRTETFVLMVTGEMEEWQESSNRRRNWFELDQAMKLLALHTPPLQCNFINQLVTTKAK